MVNIKYVLLDIEGTVCPISFVKDTLFPYALTALPRLLPTLWNQPDFQPYIQAFPAEHRTSPSALQSHVEDLTRRDVKIAYLKNLQGYLWEEGYESGAYATPLFGDVVTALERWRGAGKGCVVYSSGSVFAQKLLFGHVMGEDGKVRDLTGWFEGWFDTVNAGLKTESGSYGRIVEGLKCKPDDVLFLTDNVKEVDAAVEAGLHSILVDRPGNAPVSDADRARLKVVESFDEVKV